METKIKEITKYILHIFLTALVSALIAVLQSYIKTHGIDAGPTIQPENTAMIGAGVGALVKGLKIV